MNRVNNFMDDFSDTPLSPAVTGITHLDIQTHDIRIEEKPRFKMSKAGN